MPGQAVEGIDEVELERELTFSESGPRFLCAESHFQYGARDVIPFKATYHYATDEQIKGLFPKRQAKDDLLRPSNFLGNPCYELWIGGKLAGAATLSLSGMEFEEAIYTTIQLEAVYIARKYRGKGFCALPDEGNGQGCLSGCYGHYCEAWTGDAV